MYATGGSTAGSGVRLPSDGVATGGGGNGALVPGVALGAMALVVAQAAARRRKPVTNGFSTRYSAVQRPPGEDR